jgi:hypothetical protein
MQEDLDSHDDFDDGFDDHSHPKVMSKVLLALLALCAVLLLKFGTIDPCGILRAQIRQDAAREGGFGVVASALPNVVIDGIITEHYGPLSPGRCLVLSIDRAPL